MGIWNGFNRRGNKIIENMNLELTEDEAQDLLRCLKIALKRNKIREWEIFLR
jgi:polyphosphate kinase